MSGDTSLHACDLSFSGVLRISGSGCHRFIDTMFAGDLKPLDTYLGVTQGPFLNQEGQVIDMVNVIRTSNDEYMVLTSEINRSECFEWLEAHSELSDDNGPVFGDLSVEDVSELLGCLVVYGPGSSSIVGDLEQACQGKIALIAAELPVGAYGVPMNPAFLIICGMNVASQIGDFFNPYLYLEVLPYEEFRESLVSAGRISLRLDDPDYATPKEAGIEEFLRKGSGFVGAKALGL